jgi:hypothetical protein
MNSPIYQLLCQTLQNKIVSDQKDSVVLGKDSTVFATDSTMGGVVTMTQNKIPNARYRVDPGIHHTNPEHYQNPSSSLDRPKRLSHKGSIGNQNVLPTNLNSEIKSKRGSIQNNSQAGTGAKKVVNMRNRPAISNIPFNYNKNPGQQAQAGQNGVVQKKGASPHTGVGPKKQNTGRDTTNPKMMSISSNNSNLTSFTNKTLHSVLSPNCNFSNPNYAGNISYSTLKSTNSNIKSISKKSTKQASIKTSNSRNTQKSSVHKFQMNNNFLNLLKKKNLEHAAAQNPQNNSQNPGQLTPDFPPKPNPRSTYSQHQGNLNPNTNQNLFLSNISKSKPQKNTSTDNTPYQIVRFFGSRLLQVL